MARPVAATLLRVSPLGLTEFRQGWSAAEPLCMTQKIKPLAPLGAADECVIVPLRGTDWGGCAVSPGFVPLRGTHLGFDSLAALRATRAFGAGREGIIADMLRP